ncbi:MAG TPA: Tad domain-containing protein [Candidatus Dormibacteraeota bacterium]|nr:Tad domain-containing protein [Candidatus Dormibacteraeota bacterium]
MSAPARRRRHAQRGQAIPIVAVFAAVLLGFLALATDLSVDTQQRRVDQNITDSAALAGAYQLHDPTASDYQTQRSNAVADALTVVHRYLPWSTTGTGWAQNIVGTTATCPSGGSSCLLVYTPPAPYQNYTVDISTPPQKIHGYDPKQYTAGQSYLQVVVEQVSTNQLSQQTKEAAQSIAYHSGPDVGFGFALYTSTIASAGNASELIQGNVYAYRDAAPQANGQADICSTGAIVLGYPQFPHPLPSPDPANGALQQYNLTHGNVLTQADPNCTMSGGGNVMEAQALDTCPTSVEGVDLSTSGTPDTQYTHACVVNPPIQPPAMPAPTIPDYVSAHAVYCGTQGLDHSTGTYRPGRYSCPAGGTALTVDHPLQQGVYQIEGNGSGNDVALGTALNNCPSGYSNFAFCLFGVTFDLEAGATVTDNGMNYGAITPYVPSTPQSVDDGKMPLFAPQGSAATLSVTNNGTTLFLQGTIYMVDGTVNVGQNAHVSIRGQAIVSNWQVQSGNHQNPDITYDAGVSGFEQEVLELVK